LRRLLTIRTSLACATLLAALAAQAAAPAVPSDDDLRMAGECQALGVSIIENGNDFRDPTWRQAALVLMFAPAVLADAKFEVPFKEHPVYRTALESTRAELASQPPSPASPAYGSRLKPCLDWAARLPALNETRGKP